MKRESNSRNGLEHVPACSTWPPPWLTSSTPPLVPTAPPRVAAEPKLPEPPPDVSPWDLSPDLYERWEERVCIMHYDGRLPWKQAEALALADVLRQADPPAGKGNADAEGSAGPASEIAKAEEATAVVQATLFAVDGHAGPYGRGL